MTTDSGFSAGGGTVGVFAEEGGGILNGLGAGTDAESLQVESDRGKMELPIIWDARLHGKGRRIDL